MLKRRQFFFCLLLLGESKKEVGEVGSPKVGLFTDVVVKDPQISGSRSADGFFELVLSGKVTGVKVTALFKLFNLEYFSVSFFS